MTGPVVVFIGPTLPVAEARQILPDAVYLPPAEQASIVSAVHRYSPSAIALIDGTFLHTLAVWHKELLWALDRGIRVYGASSMGAIRAAECAPFGMVGVGVIYQAFASGEITRDDEVALAHGGPESGWEPYSEALVNIRATLTAAVGAEVLTPEQRDTVLNLAAELYFPERSWPAVLHATGPMLDATTRSALTEFVATSGVDQKRADAIELLRLLAGPTPPAPEIEPWTFNDSGPHRALQERERTVHRSAADVTTEQIFRHVMLHRGQALNVLQQASLREAGLMLAGMIGLSATDDDIAQESLRFRRRRGLLTESNLERYRIRNDLSEADFDELMAQQALLRQVTQWLRVRRYRVTMTRPLLDYLRLNDEYSRWADATAESEAVLARTGGEPETLEPLLELATDQIANTSWRPDTALDSWAEEADFGNVFQLHSELNRAVTVRRRLLAEVAAMDLAGLLSDSLDR